MGDREVVRGEQALRDDQPPDWMIPTREVLGTDRLAAGRAAGAEKTFRKDLRERPETGWGLRGLQRALEARKRTSAAVAVAARCAKAFAMPTRASKSRRTRKPARPAKAARTEIARLLDLLDRAWSGSSWHGPSVRESLRGVSAKDAGRRPVRAAHTIGELVLHMAVWKRAVRLRLGGKAWSPSAAENFPSFRARDWSRARATLAREHAALRAAFRRLTTGRLTRPAPKGGSLAYLQAHGVIHHDLWHAGQILILRRALERRSRRG